MGKIMIRDLELSFDVGHSSLGWAVLQNVERPKALSEAPRVNILGCGVVTFGADDCLASERRKKRGQRRHLRATRKRIELLAKFLIHLLRDQPDASTSDFINQLKPYVEQSAATRQLQGDGDSFAWQKAAETNSAQNYQTRAGRDMPIEAARDAIHALVR